MSLCVLGIKQEGVQWAGKFWFDTERFTGLDTIGHIHICPHGRDFGEPSLDSFARPVTNLKCSLGTLLVAGVLLRPH